MREILFKAKRIDNGANIEYDKAVQKAGAYRDGYVQACEDFGREMRRAISHE